MELKQPSSWPLTTFEELRKNSGMVPGGLFHELQNLFFLFFFFFRNWRSISQAHLFMNSQTFFFFFSRKWIVPQTQEAQKPFQKPENLLSDWGTFFQELRNLFTSSETFFSGSEEMQELRKHRNCLRKGRTFSQAQKPFSGNEEPFHELGNLFYQELENLFTRPGTFFHPYHNSETFFWRNERNTGTYFQKSRNQEPFQKNSGTFCCSAS